MGDRTGAVWGVVVATVAGTAFAGWAAMAPPAAAQTAPAPSPAPAPAPCSPLAHASITAAQLHACLAGGAVDGDDVRISGTVDLTDLGTVDHPIRCQTCTIDGDLRIADVTFSRAIDLDGLAVTGSIDARGATFRGAVLARGDRTTKSGVRGDADFALASFEDEATFDALSFGGNARFDGAQFAGSLTFLGTEFDHDLSLERASVGGVFVASGPVPPGVSAVNGSVHGTTVLRDAVFRGAADLSSRWFMGGVDASGMTVGGRLNLEKARFGGATAASPGLTLDGATLTELDAKASTFVGAADLQELRAGSIDLSGVDVQQGLHLDGTAVSGSATLRGAQVQGTLGLGSFNANAIVLDLNALGSVESPQARRAVLSKVEQTARQSGDIALANAARFRLLQIDGRKGSVVHRATDWVFYEQLAGYLVRPLRPLRALFALIVLGTVARFIVDERRERRGEVERLGPPAARTARTGHRLANLLARFARATIASLRPKPNIVSPVGQEDVEPYVIAGLRLSEYIVSKLLIVVFFLSLGNYNATLRDVLGSVKL